MKESENGTKRCTMCSIEAPYVKSTKGNERTHVSGMCTDCLSTIWMRTDDELVIQFCQKCKSFRPRTCFRGSKGETTKTCGHCISRNHRWRKTVRHKTTQGNTGAGPSAQARALQEDQVEVPPTVATMNAARQLMALLGDETNSVGAQNSVPSVPATTSRNRYIPLVPTPRWCSR